MSHLHALDQAATLQGQLLCDLQTVTARESGAPDARADGRDHALGRGDVDPWRDVEWIACRDGKYRPTQPGLRPLASGVSGRVGRLRAYGNAIVPQVAAAFIGAYMDARGIA